MQLRSSPFTYGFVGATQNVWKIAVAGLARNTFYSTRTTTAVAVFGFYHG